MDPQKTYIRRIEPLSTSWRSFAWANGVFDTARRPYTEAAEGAICTSHHLLLVTLSGGARQLDVTAACGHRFSGHDRPGTVSFVPAHCERHTRLRGVESEWASISLNPALFDREPAGGGTLDSIATFTNRDDAFLAGLAAEFVRLHFADGRLDPTYCDAMSWALACYLTGRYGTARSANTGARAQTLPAWRLRRIADYVEANLDGEIRIADLAELIGLSPGHLYRAFRASVGKTPLEYINERRIQRAMQILARETASVAETALRVGFQSPSHFTRTFRRIAGVNPADYRGRGA